MWKLSEDAYEEVCSQDNSHSRYVYGCTWNRQAPQIVATAGGDNKVCVFKVENLDQEGAKISTIVSKSAAHDQDVNAVAFNPKNAELMVSVSDD